MVVHWNAAGRRYEVVRRMPLVSLTSPQFVRRRDDKQVNPSWHVPTSDWAGDLAGQVIPPGPDNPLKARWMGFYAGAGIHGTVDLASLGTAASHGCIRLSTATITWLSRRVGAGVPLTVTG